MPHVCSEERPRGRDGLVDERRLRTATLCAVDELPWNRTERRAPLTVAEVLVLDEYARINKLALLFIVMLPFAGLSMLTFDANPTATLLYAISLAVTFPGVIVLYYLTKDTRRFRLWALVLLVVFQALTVLAATAYFGLLSPAAIVAVLLTLFAALGNYPVVGLTIWSVSAVGRLVLLGLILSGTIADTGLVTADRLTDAQIISAELLVQSILGIAFVAGRLARKSTVANINWLAQEVRDAARRELELASQIQTTILPRELSVTGFEISAHMIPASEVGGDYYDVRPTTDGCWIGIGDVSGHGITAGLIMMMVQTTVAATTLDAERSLVDIVERINQVLHANMRERLATRDFVTFQLLRLRRDGSVSLAGRHEPVFVHRVGTGACELVDPEGMWLGVRASVAAATVPVELALRPGDTLVLHTDGVTEAASADGQRYGIDRLRAAILANAQLPVAELRAAIEREVVAFTARQDDDLTLVAVRYLG
jgi:serine phosphatase RsbU (regulator of sigma subunit)